MRDPSEKPRTGRYWRNLLLVAVVGLVPVYSIIVGVRAVQETDSWMHPRRIALCCSPSDVGLEYEDAEFLTDDGLILRGWYFPSRTQAAVMVMHGLNGNREQMFNVAQMLIRHGYGVLAFDARAHGESDGEMLDALWQDALAAATFLKGRQDVDEGRIGAWGFSLGAVMAIQSAAMSQDIKAVVADGAGPVAFEDFPAPESLTDWLYVPYDAVFFPALRVRTGGFARISTKAAIARIAPRPVLLIAAEAEQQMVEGFYDAAGEPKTLWDIPGVEHGQGSTRLRSEYERQIVAFFDMALRTDGS